MGYGYDAVGHLAAVTYPDGHQAIHSYTNGAVSGITFTIGSTQLTAASAVTWRPMDSALVGWTASNGLSNTLSYDTDGRLTGIYAPAVENLGFSYDAANRLVGLSNGIDGIMSQDFGYDDQCYSCQGQFPPNRDRGDAQQHVDGFAHLRVRHIPDDDLACVIQNDRLHRHSLLADDQTNRGMGPRCGVMRSDKSSVTSST